MTVSIDDIMGQTCDTVLPVLGMESVVYHAAGVGTRAIQAHVEHEYPEPNQLGRPHIPRILVTVYNDATTGISLAELDTGSDTLTVPPAPGKTAVVKRITRLIESDSGTLTVEVT